MRCGVKLEHADRLGEHGGLLLHRFRCRCRFFDQRGFCCVTWSIWLIDSAMQMNQ